MLSRLSCACILEKHVTKTDINHWSVVLFSSFCGPFYRFGMFENAYSVDLFPCGQKIRGPFFPPVADFSVAVFSVDILTVDRWRLPVIWCPRSSICIMDLSDLWTIPFLHCGRFRVGTEIDARTDSVLAYDHRGWPTASSACRCRHGTDNGTAGRTRWKQNAAEYYFSEFLPWSQYLCNTIFK